MIDNFSGQYHWLSNFDETPFRYNGLHMKSVEHAYQATKAWDNPQLENDILNAKTPGIAKKLGRKANLPHDWETMKLFAMVTLVGCKFAQNPDLAHKLVATGNEELVEGNWWGDTYWGVCKGEGQNMLGKLLMAMRDDINGAPSVEAWCTATAKELDD